MSKQIKSKDRVKNFAEVFTAEREVKAMCDLIPEETWNNIESRFLEPCCGNGAFLREILDRKLKRCKTPEYGLKALNSIFGIDIQQDNVDESRQLLFQMYCDYFPNATATAIVLAAQIIKKRIVCGDSLKIMAEWQAESENKQLSFI